ncbi:hypothetical protein BDV93DRAFT_486785 [Ceratobasidium sp. AG-I]|nr:hypothetical protein BDV93DRAFT_486785 [Ceratobasidium sp. AG-I]
MTRLHMKKTPAERETEEDRAWRKAQRAARKGRHMDSEEHSESDRKHKRKRSKSPSSRHRHHKHDKKKSPIPSFNEYSREQDQGGWEPPPTSSKVDLDELRAEMEERRFREKLFDAMGDDAGFDQTEAYYNDFSHVPPRWREPGESAAAKGPDTSAMDDEQYAEWIREGMWKRTHRAEVEAREQAEKEKRKRKEKEKARREETKKMDREVDERRSRKQQLKEQQGALDAWGAYDAQWAQLRSSGRSEPDLKLSFMDLPWPSYPPPSLPLSQEALSKQAISAFLLSPLHSVGKPRKQRLREALLLYHPDRFVAKWMGLVRERDATEVQEAVGRVARVLTGLVEEGDQGE